MSFPLQPACSKPHRSSKPWFNKYRNKYNFLIKRARKKYFHDKLPSVSSDLRKTWSVIKQIISKREPEQHFNNMEDSSGSYSNPTQIATKFNNFLLNVGPCLANKISPTQITHREFLIGHYAKCFYMYLDPTSPTEVANTVHSLKNSKCEGFDGLPIEETIFLIAAAFVSYLALKVMNIPLEFS